MQIEQRIGRASQEAKRKLNGALPIPEQSLGSLAAYGVEVVALGLGSKLRLVPGAGSTPAGVPRVRATGLGKRTDKTLQRSPKALLRLDKPRRPILSFVSECQRRQSTVDVPVPAISQSRNRRRQLRRSWE